MPRITGMPYFKAKHLGQGSAPDFLEAQSPDVPFCTARGIQPVPNNPGNPSRTPARASRGQKR